MREMSHLSRRPWHLMQNRESHGLRMTIDRYGTLLRFPAGDAGTFPGGYAAEIHNVGNRLLVYKNDLQDGCRSKNMFDLPASMTSELTIRVSFNQMCVYNGAGVKIFKQDKCLFRFDTMYLGLNRVIHNNAGYVSGNRVGTGLCNVCVRWSSEPVADM